MTKLNWLPNSINRQRRIIGRVINNKQLPTYAYRLDERAPATIRETGFQPWNSTGTLALPEHVNGVFNGTQTLAKAHSQFVSVAYYSFLKKMDAKFLGGVLNKNIYKIDVQAASATGNFIDANDFFDRSGVDRPFADQRELTKEGGIDQVAVIEYMTGNNYYQQLDANFVAPDENLLQGWQAF